MNAVDPLAGKFDKRAKAKRKVIADMLAKLQQDMMAAVEQMPYGWDETELGWYLVHRGRDVLFVLPPFYARASGRDTAHSSNVDARKFSTVVHVGKFEVHCHCGGWRPCDCSRRPVAVGICRPKYGVDTPCIAIVAFENALEFCSRRQAPITVIRETACDRTGVLSLIVCPPVVQGRQKRTQARPQGSRCLCKMKRGQSQHTMRTYC
jgi:hypothetical protein